MDDFVTETEKDARKCEETGEEEMNEKESSGVMKLISNLVSPKPNNPITSSEVGADEGGGGIMNNLMSNIFNNHHQNEGKEEEEEEVSEKVSVVDTIVSRLPTPLADDVAPEPEEASILIHSIVHD